MLTLTSPGSSAACACRPNVSCGIPDTSAAQIWKSTLQSHDTGPTPNIALPPRRHQATGHEGRTARSLPPPAQSQHQRRNIAPKTASRPASRPAKLIIREAELHIASLHWPPCVTTRIVCLAGRGKGGGGGRGIHSLY